MKPTSPIQLLARKLLAPTPEAAAQVGPVHGRQHRLPVGRGVKALFTTRTQRFRPLAKPRGLAALLCPAGYTPPATFKPAPVSP